MTRRDWWLGVLLVILMLLVHVAIPRYEYKDLPLRGGVGAALAGKEIGVVQLRVDRWTGRLRIVFVSGEPLP